MNEGAEKEDLNRTLRLLELIHDNGMLTQRELSRKLGIALGLVNLSLKRLVHRELIKAKRLSARRVCYLLTPRGMSEKGRLSARFLADSFSIYRNARKAFLHHLIELRRQGQSRVALYGNGPLAEAAFVTVQEVGLQLVAVVGEGEPFLGRKTIPLSVLVPGTVDRVLFVGGREELDRCRLDIGRNGFREEVLDDLSGLLLEGPPLLVAEEQEI